MFLKNVSGFIRKRFGLLPLILILLIISAGIIKPDFYLLGWDNFSSYLNPKTNIFNTLFSTWREYRGLGVPSDAEVNDIFRQAFCLLASIFVPKQLVDQFYMVFMLWGGVLGMYALAKKVSKMLKQSVEKQELFGFLSAFFYLFNLSTLAVFYFPMIMYNTRFFMLPTTTLVLLNLINNSKLSIRTYLFYLAVLFIGFGCYMVPTIFIVVMMMFLFMFLIFKKTKRLITTFIFYILLGAYWLLPFANYTIQKAEIVPQAPTFIEINEAMLNKPKSYYSFKRQAKLRPSFFESNFSNLETDLYQPFHQLADHDEKGIIRSILWIFPILYLSGIFYIFFFKRKPVLVWFSITVFTFLILSMKEYSPFGFLYNFISDYIPFADTIFRFGDTKFHAMVAFSGAIIAGFFLVDLFYFIAKITMSQIRKYFVLVLVTMVVLPHFFVYKSYFTGNFIGFFMYNKIPKAYFEIAEIINQDPEAIRVVHLPIDNHGYWKPYRWGYFGSSFLNFMLNKPLFDRSFEPASMENADVHKKIIDLFHLAKLAPESSMLEERALDLYHLLSSLSIKYIIDDQTISTNINARNIAYWGKINFFDSHYLLNYLEKKGYLKLVNQYKIRPQDYMEDYANLYPYNKKQSDFGSSYNIQLYELLDIEPRIQFLSEVDKVHTKHDLYLSPRVIRSFDNHFIQLKDFDNQSLVFPFTSFKNQMEIKDDQIKISPLINFNPGTYVFEAKISPNISQTQIMDVYSQRENNYLKLYLEKSFLPVIEGALIEAQKDIATIELEIGDESPEFLYIGETILSIKDSQEKEKQFIGSVILREDSVPVGLLFSQKTYDLSSQLVQREPGPQCLHDAFENAESHITGDNGVLKINGQNVSNCLTTDVLLDQQGSPAFFVEIEFDIEGTVNSLASKKDINTGKPILHQKIAELDNPLTLQVCIKPEMAVECFNKETLFQISKNKKRYKTSFIGDLTGIDKLLVTFTIRSGQEQKYETTTTNIVLKTYGLSKLENLIVEQPDQYSHEFKLDDRKEISFSAPITISDYSQSIDLKSDGMLFRRDESCEKQNNYQIIKQNNNGVFSLVVNDAGTGIHCRNFMQKNTSFSSNNFYIWLVKYKHLSGGIPSIILMDNLNTYNYSKLYPNEILSDDYFSVPFQRPESIFTSGDKIIKAIDKTPIYAITGYIKPKFDLQDNKNKEFIIQHGSENDGFIILKEMSLIELPNYWPDSRIRPVDYKTEKFETQSQLISYKKILPSLWQVKADTQEDEFMVYFNEQYDNQWKIFGVPTIFHARCDGYANCYKIKTPDGLSTFYFFYIPEILSFIGFTITTMTVILGIILICKRSLPAGRQASAN